MIYTTGSTRYYDAYFLETYTHTPTKLGKTKTHEGGLVWQTIKEAKDNCPKEYSVYGVLADWEEDTSYNEKKNCRNLIKTSEIVKL